MKELDEVFRIVFFARIIIILAWVVSLGFIANGQRWSPPSDYRDTLAK